MSEQLAYNPDQFKEGADRVLAHSNPAANNDALNRLNNHLGQAETQSYDVAQITYDDESAAYDAAWAIKPDVDAMVQANERADKRRQAVGTFGTDSAEQINRQLITKRNVQGKAAQVDLERNYNYALTADAKELGRLAIRDKDALQDEDYKKTQEVSDEDKFIQKGQEILADSYGVKVEADKLAKEFAAGNPDELAKLAKTSIGNFNSVIRDFFSPDRIIEWQKQGALSHAQGAINDTLRSIATTAGLGENLDLFADPEGVEYALSYVSRRGSNEQVVAIAQKTMTLLSRMQTYETIVSPKGESVAPVEKRLRMINDEIAKLAPNAPPSDPRAEPERERQRVQEPEPEPERSEPVREEPKPSRPMTRQELLEQQTGRERRRPLTRQELREFGRTAMPQEERFYDRTRER